MNTRLNALRKRLEEAQCDAFFSMSPPTNQYLSGFDGSTSAVIVTESQARFLCDFRYTEQAASQVLDFDDVSEVSGSLATRVGEALSDMEVKRAAYEPQLLSVAQMQAVHNAFTGSLEARDGVVARLRQVKSDNEIEKIRAASALAEGVFADVTRELTVGMSERELAALFEYEFKRRGASGAAFDTIALFGSRTSLPHGSPGDKTLEPGDIVLLDFGCRLDGYCSDLTRTCVLGTIPSIWFEEVYDLVLTAQCIALEAVRPGISCRELDSVARNLIAEAGHGKHFGHGLGHGVGIEVHETPRLNAESDTILEPGMVVTIEPGIYLPERGGVRIEDLVAVTSDGCELLSSTPKELRILPL